MNSEIAHALLAGFSGRSPVLPPFINDQILQVYLAARDPERPRSGPERDLLETNCLMGLWALHKHHMYDTDHEARVIVETASREGRPFALYLRNFSLGSRLGEAEERPDGFSEVDTIDPGDDRRFQDALIEHVQPQIPVIAIENPTLELRHPGALPRLSLTDDTWQQVVGMLIPAAAVIFVYIDAVTDSVLWELGMVRSAGRGASTALFFEVREQDEVGPLRAPPSARSFDEIDRTQFGIAQQWEPEKAGEILSSALARLPRLVPDVPGPLELPPPPAPPPALRQHCDAIVDMGLMAGSGFLSQGKLGEAMDALIASIACSFWSQNEHARAFGLRYLANVLLQRGKIGYALEVLEHAIDLFERFARDDAASVANVMREVTEFDETLRDLPAGSRWAPLQTRLKTLAGV